MYERRAHKAAADKTSSTNSGVRANATSKEVAADHSPSRNSQLVQEQTPISEDSPRSTSHNLSRIVVSANGIPSYHGQTSALFEESQQARGGLEVRSRMPDEWVEKGLIAEAARQRAFNICQPVSSLV